MALPPMVFMPVSKARRVRRLAFSNISTICLASRAWRYSRGLRLTSWPSLRMARTSALERSLMEHMSSPASRAAAVRTSSSCWTASAVVCCSRNALLATCLSSCMGGAAHGVGVGVGGKDLIQRGDGVVDMRGLKNERRQKAQDGITGAVDEDVPLQHFLDDLLGHGRGVEFGGEHESFAAHVDDGVVAIGETAQELLEVVAD